MIKSTFVQVHWFFSFFEKINDSHVLTEFSDMAIPIKDFNAFFAYFLLELI